MKPSAYTYKLPYEMATWELAFEGKLSAIRAQEYPKVIKEMPLYAIPKELPPELVDALNEAIMASTCAEQVWERFYPKLIDIEDIV